MSDAITKYRLKYLKAANSFLIVSIFVIIRTLFFLCKNESMIYLLEINRLVNYLDLTISDSFVFWGQFLDIVLSIGIAGLIFFIWKDAQKGKIKVYAAFVGFYFLDMFLYFFTYDMISFIIHFIFLAYMVFGLIFYKKMYVEYLISKNNKKEE